MFVAYGVWDQGLDIGCSGWMDCRIYLQLHVYVFMYHVLLPILTALFLQCPNPMSPAAPNFLNPKHP